MTRENVHLIRRKIQLPPLPDRAVARPRLTDLLDDALHRHQTVQILGTAGSGKTTAVRQYLAATGRRVAWLSLDDTDCASGRLLTYLEAALASAVPEVAGTVASALAAGIPHAETAGLLAEATDQAALAKGTSDSWQNGTKNGATDSVAHGADDDADVELVLVLDEVERLGGSPAALAVLDGLLRYAPESLRFLLVSRRAVRLGQAPVPRTGPGGPPAVIGEADLALTRAEADQVIAGLPGPSRDVEQLLRVTRGWVTGVCFLADTPAADDDAWPSHDTEPLSAYISQQLLDGLTEDQRDFLIGTSVLDVVTVPRAEALGFPDAARTLTALRAHQLPAVWEARPPAMRLHLCFRDCLVQQLDEYGAVRARAARLTAAELLGAEGRHEEAAEAFISLGDTAAALPHAVEAIEDVIERGDHEVAERWLDQLAYADSASSSPLTTAELMLAVGREDYRRGVRIADQLHQLGERDAIASRSTRAAAMMAWSYYHACRVDDLERLLRLAPPGDDIEAVHYLASLVDSRDRGRTPPSAVGVPAEGLIARAHYWRGRLNDVLASTDSRWAGVVSGPWRIAALRALGRLDEADRLLRAAVERGVVTAGLSAVVGVELSAELGQEKRARAFLTEGRAIARRNGSLVWDMFSMLAEAKLELRLCRNPRRARRVLDELEALPYARSYQSTGEQLDALYGFALLGCGTPADDAEALLRLRRAVVSMHEADRILELCAAAVYLAEAEWRAGDPDAADRAADLALATAYRLGTRHALLGALRAFPGVLSRRLDGLTDTDSSWHSLGRPLLSTSARPQLAEVREPLPTAERTSAVVEFHDLGSTRLLVDGELRRPRIAKSYELMGLLLAAPERTVTRTAALDALFDSRSDNSARAYLRQAVHHLRLVLPDEDALRLEDGTISLAGAAQVTTYTDEFTGWVATAAETGGEQRLTRLTSALAVAAHGPYLPRATSAWAEKRRADLARLVLDVTTDAAELAWRLDTPQTALALAEQALEGDPYRESMWRLLMRIAGALGQYDEVITHYRRCGLALEEVSASPSSATRRLLAELRHG
ncbi:BTAD domain-containing putative transcriptional regulator [Streptomyces sp. NPDC056291]|uniref:BTAD domain-containing putative transcriptional regulator n=1 Tax=unclassified Streptomyces TaxID=2593676 RepID=UPI0035DC1C7E